MTKVATWAPPLVLAGAMLGCVERPPHFVVTIEDPQALAQNANTVAVGIRLDALEARVLADALPVTITVVAPDPGRIETFWAEARDGDTILARGSTSLSFDDGPTKTARVRLASPCDVDSDCDDQNFCNGQDQCVRGACVAGAPPCPRPAFACAVVRCLEEARACDVQVDHGVCASGDGERYCDPTAGCVAGQPCYQPADCQDDSVCNGAEQCVAGRCIAGSPLDVDDGSRCTIDACVEPSGAAHFPDPAAEESACVRPDGMAGLCLQGACVASVCGDGIVDGRSETCDDGNQDPNDGCHDCAVTRWLATLVAGLGPTAGDPLKEPNEPNHLTIDRAGDLYYIAGARGVRRVSNGVRTEVTSAVGTTLAGIAVDGLGNVFLSDAQEHRVYRIDHRTGDATVIAGFGVAGFAGDGGPAVAARLDTPGALAIDGRGTLFIADRVNRRIRRVDGATGVISTVAGTGVAGDGGDNGQAIDAQLGRPGGLAVDGDGTVYFADTDNDRVRAIVDGRIRAFAGTGVEGSSGDNGPALDAELTSPTDVAVDSSGNVVIADGASRVRRVDRAGRIQTIAGNGQFGSDGDGARARAARLRAPRGVAIDGGGHVFIIDGGSFRIRRVDAQTDIISTVIGSGVPRFVEPERRRTSTPLFRPTQLAIGPSQLVLTDAGDLRLRGVRLVPTTSAAATWIVAGTGQLGPASDAPRAQDSPIGAPWGVAVAADDDVYFVEQLGGRVFRIDAISGRQTTVAGGGTDLGEGVDATAARLVMPFGIALDGAENLYIADAGRGRVRRVDAATGLITTVAGGGPGAAGTDGLAIEVALDEPVDLALDGSGNVFICERRGARVRRLDVATGFLSTVAGDGTSGSSGDGGPGTNAQLNAPEGVAVDSTGTIVVIADTLNTRIRRVDFMMNVWSISTVAGSDEARFSGDGGSANDATFVAPHDVSLSPSLDVFITERTSPSSGVVRRIDATTSVISTFAGAVFPAGDGMSPAARLGRPAALVSMQSSLLIADGPDGRVRSFDGHTLETVAGYPNGMTADGVPALYSSLLADAAGLVFDRARDAIYVSDRGEHVIDRLDVSTTPWTRHRFAGAIGSAGHRDGPRALARFDGPSGLALDPDRGLLYVADAGNEVVRRIDLASGEVSTFAGSIRENGFAGDGGPARLALLNKPEAVAVAADGSLFIADRKNHRVRRVDPAGDIETVVGDGTPASTGDGTPARVFSVDDPRGLVVGPHGNLFVSSRTTVREIVAGPLNVATGDDAVRTIYGPPRGSVLPTGPTFCASGLTFGVDDARLFLVDACGGYLIELMRQ